MALHEEDEEFVRQWLRGENSVLHEDIAAAAGFVSPASLESSETVAPCLVCSLQLLKQNHKNLKKTSQKTTTLKK